MASHIAQQGSATFSMPTSGVAFRNHQFTASELSPRSRRQQNFSPNFNLATHKFCMWQEPKQEPLWNSFIISFRWHTTHRNESLESLPKRDFFVLSLEQCFHSKKKKIRKKKQHRQRLWERYLLPRCFGNDEIIFDKSDGFAKKKNFIWVCFEKTSFGTLLCRFFFVLCEDCFGTRSTSKRFLLKQKMSIHN